MTRSSLCLLLAEDSDDDAVLVLEALERHGYNVESTRVMTADGFRSALAGGKFEIILCAHSMPGFGAMEALEILHESGNDIPLIIVSGTIGEVVAVEAMRRGAVDYLLKDNLIRLGAAVERELRDAESRRQKRLFDSFSHSQSEVLEMILNGEPLVSILERIVLCVETLSSEEVSCSVMLVNPEGSHLVLGAGAGFPDGFFETLGPVPIGQGMGPCGKAAAFGGNAVVEDVARYSDSIKFRDLARRYGLRACWSVPVFSSEHVVIGTMGIFYRIPHTPTAEEIRWVESASKLASLAIERSRAAGKLQASETLLRIASETTHIGGWIVDFAETRVTWSDQVCAIHDMPPGTSPGFDEALEFIAPEWRAKISGVFEKCLFDGAPFDEEIKIITARGRQVWVRASGEGIRDVNGAVTRIQGAFQDITDRRLAEEAVSAGELRYLEQRNALIALTKGCPSDQLEIGDAFRRITETTAKTMGVARVSIWRFTEDRSMIECRDLYETASGAHTSGVTLLAADYPAYFAALTNMETIAADDAMNDPRTREFREDYLTPLGIGAMMDVPVLLGNRLDHVLCCEHVGAVRHWTPDEKTFAVAIGSHVSLALESRERALAQQEVLTTHQRFQSVAAATNDTIWDWDLVTDEFWWNDGFAHLFGWSASDTEKNIHAWIRQIHPDDRSRVVKGVCAAIDRGETHWTDEYRFISNDGTISHVLDRGQVLRDAEGKGVRMVGGMTDLTASRAAERELARSHRALRMLSSCNEMLIRASDENELLHEACRIAVENGGYRMAWVGYAINDEKRSVVPMAHAGEESDFLSEIEISWADDLVSGSGPSGEAIRTGETTVMEDFCLGHATPQLTRSAERRGYRSAVCLPLHDDLRVFGVLTLYGDEPISTSEHEIMMLRELANDLSFGIGNIRSREERRRTEEIVVKVAQAVSSGTGSEFFDLLARNMVEALGARGGIIGRLDGVTHSIHSISYFLDGKAMEPVSYHLAGTPCEKVIVGDICVFEEGVRDSFPEDHLLGALDIEAYVGIPLLNQHGGVTGIMAVLFSEPLKETALVRSTLRIFAARAASELDRKVADARISEQASLLDKARDAILVRDLDHTITYWNKSAERLYGWTAEEAIGRSVESLLYQETTAFGKAHLQTLLAGEWTGELIQIDKNGLELTIEGRWTLVRDDKGRPQSVFAINTDISEHRKLEQQFLRAQRLESIGTLAGGIAHDLNNILAPITMAVELMKMRSPDDKSVELLDTISGSAKRGANLVGQVLSFARGMEGCRVAVHPGRIISEIECILRDTFPRNIVLDLHSGRDLWPINGDPTQLHQVLLNLCVNARDAISGEGKIRVSAENLQVDEPFAAINLEAKEGPHVCIVVEDTGEGIAPEIMDRIFDPFFTTKSVGKGTGLGLPTTLAIVKSHGGFIRTDSKPGEGTCFRIYLPAFPETEDPPAAIAPAALPKGAGRTVLIVDDEDAIRHIAQKTLEMFGYRTLVAANGQQAISMYERYQSAIDIVLTDMMMPVMDGPAAIRGLVEINPAVRIVATSGLPPDPESVRNTRDFLPKPYSAEALLRCLDQALRD